MPRPRKDGTAARAVNRQKFTEKFIQSARAEDRLVRVTDTVCPGLVLAIQPTGRKSYKVRYSARGKLIWHNIGDVRLIDLEKARRIARDVMLAAVEGKDPAAVRATGTFEEAAAEYLEKRAKLRNKSWRQAEALVRKYLLPRWGRLSVAAITRADVKDIFVRIRAPILANQTFFAARSIFSWLTKEGIIAVNPCNGVERNPTNSRSRVLFDHEIKKLWPMMPALLRLILLLGQRPGEVRSMRPEDIKDDGRLWKLPGKPTDDGWQGTKNGCDHHVWLPEQAQALIPEYLAAKRGPKEAGRLMQKLVARAGIDHATPHDLRRTCLTIITKLKFGRDAMARVANHRTRGVAGTYDRHEYHDEDREMMAAVARHIMSIVEPQHEQERKTAA